MRTGLHRIRVRHLGNVAPALVGLLLALVPVAATGSSAATATSPQTSAVETDSSTLTITQWKQRYTHYIGILADDVLVVVDDGKRAQTHDTKAKAKLTLKDCRKWGQDASEAPAAAPPIPLASAQRSWVSMYRHSSGAAADCVAALTRGSRPSAKDFQKQLAVVEKDEQTLVRTLNH